MVRSCILVWLVWLVSNCDAAFDKKNKRVFKENGSNTNVLVGSRDRGFLESERNSASQDNPFTFVACDESEVEIESYGWISRCRMTSST